MYVFIVTKTLEVQNAMKEGDFNKCIEARGRSFANNLSIYKILSRLEPSHTKGGSFPPHVSLIRQ